MASLNANTTATRGSATVGWPLLRPPFAPIAPRSKLGSEISMENPPVRKTVLVIAALFACTFTMAASAQSAFIDRKQVSPATARKLVDACIARAEQQKQIVGCAVVDIAGVLVDFHTMGGQATFAETAILKAKTAAHWQRTTSALEDDVNSKRNGASVWIGDFPRAGGVPIMVDGQVAGAMGVGGGSEDLAKAAIEAVLGKQPQSAQR
jgi:glc operon protein GlcG